MASKALDIIAMSEAIGASAPMSDDEGVLRHAPNSAPTYNRALRDRKPPVEINQEFLDKHKEKALAGKSIVELAEKIGNQGLEGADVFNQDLDSVSAARNKACRVLNEAIQLLSEGDLDYWCPDDATRQAAPKIKVILEKFSSRFI
jgi:hypothetical protein